MVLMCGAILVRVGSIFTVFVLEPSRRKVVVYGQLFKSCDVPTDDGIAQ